MIKPTIVKGLEKLYIAQLTADDSIGGFSFNTPVYYPGVQEIGLKLNHDKAELFAENTLYDQESIFTNAELTISLAHLTSAEQATIFGRTTAAAGGVYATLTDDPPFFAVLYKASLPGGYKRYGVFFKVRFMPPDANMKTQEGKVAFAEQKTVGTAFALQYNGFYEYHVDTSDPNGSGMTDATWFGTVTMPAGDTTPPTISSTTPALNATGVANTTTYQWVFSEAIATSTIIPANFFLIKDTDQSVVAGTLSYSADQKTITFAPGSNLSSGSVVYFAIATIGVRDLASNPIANMAVRKFTTT